MESWVGLGGNEGRTNIQILAEPGIEPGILWSEGRDLTNCANYARPPNLIETNLICKFGINKFYPLKSKQYSKRILSLFLKKKLLLEFSLNPGLKLTSFWTPQPWHLEQQPFVK